MSISGLDSGYTVKYTPPEAFRSSLGLRPRELLQAEGYIWPYILPLVLIRIHSKHFWVHKKMVYSRSERDTQTDIRTLRLNRPKGRFSERRSWQHWLMEILKHILHLNWYPIHVSEPQCKTIYYASTRSVSSYIPSIVNSSYFHTIFPFQIYHI